jgi:HSP20 family molecular chaperone IbpA
MDINPPEKANDKDVPKTTYHARSFTTSPSLRLSKTLAKRKCDDQTPLIDVFQEQNSITIVAQITGFNKEALKINVKDQKLTLSAKTKDRRYYKSLNLPKLVIPHAMHTTFKNGVLEIKFKKAEAPEAINKEAD